MSDASDLDRPGDAVRIFITAWLVYLAFWNPWLQSTMTWAYLDAAISFIESGRWQLVYATFYGGHDTAIASGVAVSTQAPGASILIVPFWELSRLLDHSPVTPMTFKTLNAGLALAVGATASALTCVQVAWLARRLGASRRASLCGAFLFAFGTTNFFFGTTFFKENVSGLATVTAVRVALQSGSRWQQPMAGVVAGVAGWLTYPSIALVPLVTTLVYMRDGVRRALVITLATTPFVVSLIAFNAAVFGAGWRFSSFFPAGQGVGIRGPSLSRLIELLVGLNHGLFVYSPFLLLGLWGAWLGWKHGARPEALAALGFLAAAWIATAGFQSSFDAAAPRSSAGIVTLGARQMFPAVPLLASFVGLAIDRSPRRLVYPLAVLSVAFGYLNAQAGMIPGTEPLPYVLKTWVSGTGMGILFKEAFPAWLGIETLHTVIVREDVEAVSLLKRIAAGGAFHLVLNQALMILANVVALAGVAAVVVRVWSRPAPQLEEAV